MAVLIGSTPPRKCEDDTSLAHTWDAPQGMDGPRAEADGMQTWTPEAEEIDRTPSHVYFAKVHVYFVKVHV